MVGRSIAIAWLLWLSVPQALAVGSTGGGDDARLELRKSAGPVTVDPDGTYRVVFEIFVRNSGATKLYKLQVQDPIASQIAPAEVVRIEGLSVSGDLHALNPDYNGDDQSALLDGGEWLKPEAEATIRFTLVFDPQGAPGPFHNVANGVAVDPDGRLVVHECAGSGTGGCGQALIDIPEPAVPARVGLAKSAAESVLLPSGEFLTTLSFVLANLGEREVLELALIDDLRETFAEAWDFRVIDGSITGSSVAVNPDYNGRDRSNLLAPGNRLNPGATATLSFGVAFDPGPTDPPFYNRALLSGVDPATGSMIEDWSNAGWDPESPGSAPTPIYFAPALLDTAAVGVSKAVESLEASESGYEIAFHIRVKNLGPVRIDAVQVEDDLALAFPDPARVSILSGPILTGALSGVNTNFGPGDPALLSGTDFLEPGETADIRFRVLLVLNGAAGPFANQAIVTGLDPRGEPVSDVSDEGSDPDSDGDGDPGGQGEDDATPIDLPAGISGLLYRDQNHNRIRDEGDSPADRWIVVVTGELVEELVRLVVDSQGRFEVPELPPGDYRLTFLNPDNGVAWGQASVRVPPGARPRVDELVDAQGIVYESGRRVALPGVVLSLGLAEGGGLPAACMLPGQQNQTVDSSGAYRFDVRFGAADGCPASTAGLQLNIVDAPGGFIAAVSREIPPETDPLNLGVCAITAPLPCVVQPQSGPPAGSTDSRYYLSLLWGPGDAGTANNHIPIDRQGQSAAGGEILVEHSVDRTNATIGDVLGFRVEVQNLSDVPLAGVTTLIHPPAGLPALDDSLELVRAGPDGVLETADDLPTRLPVSDPRSFEAAIGVLAARERVVIRYAARVSPGATPGVKVSTVDGLVESGVGDSASASVRIAADPMLQKTTIIGKVFHDLDNDGIQSEGERGIPAVRLATLEGLLVETDAEGRFHIADVDTGRVDRGANFMIKLDALSLPEGLDARRVLRQVVRLTPGLMTRINFPVRTDTTGGAPSIEDSEQARTDGLRGEPRLDVLALPRVLVRNVQGVQKTEFAVYSNYGLLIAGYQIALFDLTDPRFPRLIRPPELLSLSPVDGRSDLLTGSVEVPVAANVQRIGYRLIALGTCVPDDNLPPETMLRLLQHGDFKAGAATLDQNRSAIPGMGVRWVFDQTAMRLLEVRGNSETLPAHRSAWEIFGHSNLAIQTIPVRGYQTIQRRGATAPGIVVDVEPIPIPDALRDGGARGDLEATYQLIDQAGTRSDSRPMPLDTETWAVFDHEGLRPERVGIVEFDPNRAVGSIKKDLPFADATGARGLHRTIMECGCTLMAAETIIDREALSLSLRLTNLSELSQTPTLSFDGVDGRTLRPMGQHMSQEIFLGKFDPTGYVSSSDWRNLRVRFSTATPAGYVPEFQLERKSTFEPQIRASCDGVSAWPDTTSAENLLAAMVVGGKAEPPPPAADALFAMGLINLTLGANDVSGNLEALKDDDHYDESVFVDGRVAGYLRGKIRGRYLVTAQIDTTEDELKNLGNNLERKDPERIFRQLDPDRYYPVYGDDSTTTSDVESQGAMYLRVDWDESSALWGNYNTGFTDTEFAQYNRSLYGAKLDYASAQTNRYGERRQGLKVFASEAQTRSAQASFRATGGSLYYLPHTDLLEGSEKLWIEVRARDSERVLDTEILLPGRDYEIDDLQGRILLARPLASVVRERNNSIVRSAPLEGDRVFLVVDYEHVPGDFTADDLTAGLRAKWTTDTLGLGLSRVSDQRDGRDYTLTGTDARWRFSEHSFLLGEFARSEARQNDVNTLSFDGGLTFSDALLPEASDDLEGEAWGVEARIDMADLPAFRRTDGEHQGELRLWHKARESGFSSGRLGESGEVIDSGMSMDLLVSDSQTFSTSASWVERELGRDESVVRAQTDVRLACESPAGCLDLGLEGRYEKFESELPGDIAPVGDALLVGARLGKALSVATTLYGSAQTAAERSADYPGNDLFSVGMNQTLSDQLGISVEVSDGDRGEAVIAGVDYVREDGATLNLSGGVGSGAMTQFGTRYALAEGNEVYGSYTVDTDRTDGARNLLTLGQRRQMDDAVGVFTETTFGRDDGYADSAHVFGLDYQADQNWLISARLQASDLQREGVDLERQVASVGASYQAHGTRVATRAEVRRDQSGGLDTWQYLTSNLFGMKSESGDRRWIGKLNLAWTDNDAAGVDAGRFAEFDLGYALRPVNHDRINALAKYSYLYDLGSNGQLGPNGRAGNQLEERSHVLSAEVLYDLSESALGVDGVEVGTKLAAKLGEQRVFEAGDWYDTRLAFAAVRARYRLVGAEEEIGDGHWEALTEYRLLKDFEDDSLRHGALLGVYYVKPVSIREDTVQMRVGVGYNFTDFDSDLRRDSYRSGGWFIDVSAAY